MPPRFLKRAGATVLLLLLVTVNNGFMKPYVTMVSKKGEEPALYDKLRLAKLGLKREVFEQALAGLKKMAEAGQVENPGILSIADMSQSSNSKRLYVIDLEHNSILFNTYVSHGRNSGEEYAVSFANKPESYKSSLGFYVTQNCYHGAHGLSLRLNGLEKGINDNALNRGIVVHGADYVSENFIRQHGRLGRSQGCPAVPAEECVPIVNTIKEGTCFFVFFPDNNYLEHSYYCEK